MAGSLPFHVGLPRTNYASGRTLWEQAQKGMREVSNNFAQFVRWLDLEVTPEVLSEALEPTMELAAIYTPVDTGALIGSQYNEVRKSRSGVTRAEVGYNRNGEAPYAIFVHEMPQFYHTPPTQYKFLQRALDEDTPEIIGRIAAGIKARTGL